jgi:hypothetical protein
MVVAAVSLAALLGFTALVINVGMLLTERRHLQNAADAAALAGGQRIGEEQTSRSFRDARVLSAVTTLARENDVDVGGTRQLQAAYVDLTGTLLGSVGGSTYFPEAATGVQVSLSGPVTTILSAFAGQDAIQAQADTRAGLSSVAFPNTLANPVPLAVPLAAFQAGAAYDLYDQTVALASYGVSGYRPFLHLTHASNVGSGYLAATDFSDLSVDLQYWSDGLHNTGQLGLNNTIALAGGSFGDQVRAGLLDNVRRQGLTDANGASYALVDVPLWNSYQVGGGAGSGAVVIVGFARFKILASDVTNTTLPGYFVPYLVATPSSGTAPGVRWGPSRLALLR